MCGASRSATAPSMCAGRADIQDRVVMASRPRSPRSLPRHRSHVKAGSFPNQSVIARDILDPLARGAFSVGRVADLDSFLTAQPFLVKEEDPDLWQHYQLHWQQMIAEVGANWPASDPEYQLVGHGLIQPATEAAATVFPKAVRLERFMS